MASLGIAFAASEVAPFAKVGGLADVASALPRFLHRQGHDVRVFLPLYARIYPQAGEFHPVEFAQEVPVQLGWRNYRFSLYTRAASQDEPGTYFIHCPSLYDRPGLYSADADEHLRFILLCRAVIESCQRMGWGPDIFHCNDWQTALIPLYLKSVYAWDRLFERSRTLLTIHNIGYQGTIGADSLMDLELGEHSYLLHQDDLRSGQINLLKTGILHADLLTTVSPTYAREIQSGELGMGMQADLSRRPLVGILNGVDYSEWSPEGDPFIPSRYSAEDLSGKRENKRVLLGKLGLQPSAEAPVLGVVSRLTAQKGLDLVVESMPRFLNNHDLRLALLGSGEPRLEDLFFQLQRTFRGRVCYYRGFSNELAHLIEAGSDLFLMPSLFEPCGLNQMYSLRYGTVPVVRKTGGLADSVELYNPQTRQGTGFVFEHYNREGFSWALDFALATFRDQDAWKGLMQNGMKKDYSWDRQGQLYLELYWRLTGKG